MMPKSIVRNHRQQDCFIVSLLTTPKTAHTITGIRLWDITGRICGGLEVAVKRTANQGVLAKFEFPIYEKGDE